MTNRPAPHPALRPLPGDLADHLDLVLTGTGHDADDVLDALTAGPSTAASEDGRLAEIRDGYTVHAALDAATEASPSAGSADERSQA